MGGGAATVTAVFRQLLTTPFRASSSLVMLLLVLATLSGVGSSKTLVDDFVGAMFVLIIGLSVYTQSDWLMPVAEILSDEVVWRIPTTQEVAALTIDDVPLFDQPSVLEEILNVLRANKVTATFMVMSGFDLPHTDGGMEDEARKRCRALLTRAVAEGHELANHLQFDKPAMIMTDDEFDKAFLHCDHLLAELSGGEESWRSQRRRWFRPASAVWNEHMLSVAREYGYTPVIGNCHPFDAADVSRHFNSAYLKTLVKGGDIIVVHDRWHTPQTLQEALPVISKRLQLVTVSELCRVAEKDPAKPTLRDRRLQRKGVEIAAAVAKEKGG